MDFYDTLKGRHSVRKYRDIPLSWDVLTRVVDSVRYAPTSGNLQNFKFVVVLNKSFISAIAEASANQLWMQTAPVLIVVCAELEKAKKFYGLRGERLYAVQNASNAAMIMSLAAHAEGLSSCWVGAFNEDEVVRILNIPSTVRPQAILALGYSDEKPRAQPKYELANLFYIDLYGNKVFDWNEYLGWTSVKVEKSAGKTKDFIEKAAKVVKDKIVQVVQGDKKEEKKE